MRYIAWSLKVSAEPPKPCDYPDITVDLKEGWISYLSFAGDRILLSIKDYYTLFRTNWELRNYDNRNNL
jgi:hypothetical protein